MGTAYSSSMFGLDDPNAPVNPLAPKPPAVAGTIPPSIIPGSAPPLQPPTTGMPPTSVPGVPAQQPTPVPQQTMLGLDPVAGPQLSGAQRYYDEATNAVRDKFKLWNDEQFGRDTAGLEQQLRNRGIKPGDESYNRELQGLRETQGKLRSSSDLDAILTGGAEAERFLGMDDRAATSNLNRQLGVANNTRADNADKREAEVLKTAEKHYNDDVSSGIIGQGVSLLDKFSDGGLLGLANKGVDAVSGGINKLTGGATTGLLTKGAGLLGLGGGASAGAINAGLAGTQLAGMGAELAAATNAAAPGLSAAMAGNTAATTAATTTGGLMQGVMAAAPWVAAAVVAAMVLDKNLPQSSPLNHFDPNSGGWTKGENFANTKFEPAELNAFFGPALKTFAQGGDIKAALSALPQPRNEREKILLDKGVLHLFSGTGNPMRQIAKQKGFGEGAWTASSDAKKSLKKELGIK